MTDTCALCGNKAREFASIRTVSINGEFERRYCHEGESPTCFEQARFAMTLHGGFQEAREAAQRLRVRVAEADEKVRTNMECKFCRRPIRDWVTSGAARQCPCGRSLLRSGEVEVIHPNWGQAAFSDSEPIDDLVRHALTFSQPTRGLGERAYNCLRQRGFKTVGEVRTATDESFAGVLNFGKACLWLVRFVLGPPPTAEFPGGKRQEQPTSVVEDVDRDPLVERVAERLHGSPWGMICETCMERARYVVAQIDAFSFNDSDGPHEGTPLIMEVCIP